jgi:hypothetical protein
LTKRPVWLLVTALKSERAITLSDDGPLMSCSRGQPSSVAFGGDPNDADDNDDREEAVGHDVLFI